MRIDIGFRESNNVLTEAGIFSYSMEPYCMERRNFLRASLAVTGSMALGGCSIDDEAEGSSFPTRDIPSYSAWLPADPHTNDFVQFTHSNIQHIHDAQNGTPAAMSDEDSDAGTLFGLPVYGFKVTSFSFYSSSENYPWSDALGQPEEPDGMATEALTTTEGVVIFHGDYNTEVFANDYTKGFDEVDGHAGFTIFEGQAGGETEGIAYAVSTDAVVVVLKTDATESGDDLHRVYQAIETHHEKVERVVDDDDGQWLFETTGPADMAMGVWNVDGFGEGVLVPVDTEAEDVNDTTTATPGDDGEAGNESDTTTASPGGDRDGNENDWEPPFQLSDAPAFDNVDSFVSTLALPSDEGGVGGDEIVLRFAALYPEGEAPSEEELRDELPTDDSNVEVNTTIVQNRVYALARRLE
jgi:hypothetical protein